MCAQRRQFRRIRRDRRKRLDLGSERAAALDRRLQRRRRDGQRDLRLRGLLGDLVGQSRPRSARGRPAVPRPPSTRPRRPTRRRSTSAIFWLMASTTSCGDALPALAERCDRGFHLGHLGVQRLHGSAVASRTGFDRALQCGDICLDLIKRRGDAFDAGGEIGNRLRQLRGITAGGRLHGVEVCLQRRDLGLERRDRFIVAGRRRDGRPGDGSRPANCSPPAPSSAITPPTIPAAMADRLPLLRSGVADGRIALSAEARVSGRAVPNGGGVSGSRPNAWLNALLLGYRRCLGRRLRWRFRAHEKAVVLLSVGGSCVAPAAVSLASAPLTAGCASAASPVRGSLGAASTGSSAACGSSIRETCARFEFDGDRLLARLRMPYLRRLYHERAPLILVETIDAGTPPQRRPAPSGDINRKRGRVMTRPGKKFEHRLFVRRFGGSHTSARDSRRVRGRHAARCR